MRRIYIFNRLQVVKLLLWMLSFVGLIGVIVGCSKQYYKEDADKEVYQIIDSKWQDEFGQKANYRISDVPPSPNDIQVNKLLNSTESGDASEGSDPKTCVLTLAQAVALATAQNRDYQTQKESLYQSALSLTGTRYNYALKWFGTIDTTYTDNKSTGAEDVELNASGEMSKNTLLLDGVLLNTNIAIDWIRFLIGDPRNSLSSVLSGDLTVPLLGAGAGKAAQEQLTQAERNVLYQIRTFNRYRQTFVVSIISDYYRVLQQRESVDITRASYERQVESTKQLRMEVEVGQRAQSDADEAEQRLISAQNSLVSAEQSYMQTLDSFKIRLSLPADADIVLDQNELRALEGIGISQPDYTEEEAISLALTRRLDLVNTKDAVVDAARRIELAAEGLGVQLNLNASANVQSPGPQETDFTRLQFQKGIYSAGLEADLPLDRKSERNAYREALITFTQRQRSYENSIDQVKLDIRNAYRQLKERAESYRIQKLGLKLAERRVEQQRLMLEYGRGTVRLLLESEDALVAAQNAVTRALIDHTIAKMGFFRDVGILEVRPDGMWEE